MISGAGIVRGGGALLIACAVAVAVAAYVLGVQQSNRAPKFQPRPMFADVRGQVNAITRLVVESKEGRFEIVKAQAGGWVVPAKHQYPASQSVVRAIVLGVSELTVLEPKTNRPERYSALGLGSPQEGGEGVDLTLYADTEQVARLIIGKPAGRARLGAPTQFYVRGATDTEVVSDEAGQAWLASAPLSLPLPVDPMEWVETDVLGLARQDIASVTVQPPSGPAYTLARESADLYDVELQAPPAGRMAQDALTLNATAFALVGLSITDVRPGDEVDFSAATHIAITRFDGTEMRVDVTAADGTYWLRTAAPSAMAAPASAIWAFAVPQYKYAQLTKGLEDMLAPPEAPAP